MLERLGVWALGSRHKLISNGRRLLMVVSCSICFGITFITLFGFPRYGVLVTLHMLSLAEPSD